MECPTVTRLKKEFQGRLKMATRNAYIEKNTSYKGDQKQVKFQDQRKATLEVQRF